MTNPYEAFNISDDEEDQFVGTAKTDKARKSIHIFNIQLTKKEDKWKNSVNQKPQKLPKLTLKSQPESETMPRKSDTTDPEDQLREFQKDTPLIEEAELAEMTDQEKEEETLETWKTNWTKTNSKRENKLLPPHLNKPLKFNKNNKNQKNPKN